MTSSPAPPAAEPLRLETFRGLSYADSRELADNTLAPPAMWDFGALADQARAREHQVLRLLSPSLAGGGTALTTAADWVASGALRVDTTAHLYRWRWSQAGRSVTGVAGALRLPAPRVRPHEQVRRGLLAERAAELGSAAVQPEPILLLYDGAGPLTTDAAPAEALVDLRADDGHHTVTALSDPAATAHVNDVLAGASLVVADGHHRFSVLSRLPEPRPRAFVLVVDMRRSQLAVGPIPRVVTDLGWETVAATPGATLTDLSDGQRQAYLVAVPDGRLRWLVGDASRVAGLEMPVTDRGTLARDVEVLHSQLLPAWGVDDAQVHYAHSWEAACSEATIAAGLAVASRPPGLDEVMTAARAGTPLPHKATSIAPKPRAGLLMLGDGIAES